MSKFDEMCAAYVESRKNWFSYRDKCSDAMRRLAAGFIKYCEIPEDQVRLVPVTGEDRQGKTFSLLGAMNVEDQGFWQLGMQITLFEKPNQYPHQPILIVLGVKDHDGKLQVMVGKDGEVQLLNIDDKEQLANFYDKLVILVKKFFRDGLQEFLEKSAPLKTIGFVNPLTTTRKD